MVINEIKEFGTWILPLRHGEVVPSKPPLFHWLSAILSLNSSPLTEFFLRLPSILSAIFCVVLVYRFLKKTTEDGAIALNGALILSSMYGFLQMALDGRVDMLFTVLFLGSVLCLNDSILNRPEGPRLSDKVNIGLLLGLGVLSRGPLALVLFFICLVTNLIIFKKFSLLKKWFFDDKAAIVLIPLFISTPWYLASKFLGKPELISRQLVFENISRFFGGDQIITKPVWFYLAHFWSQGSLWTLVLLGLFYLYFIKRNEISSSKNSHIARLFLTQVIGILIFLSLASGKRRAYLLQLLPLLSIYIALSLDHFKTFNFSPINNKLKIILSTSSSIFLAIGILEFILILFPLSWISKSYFIIALDQLSYRSLIIPTVCGFLLYFTAKKLDLNNSNFLITAFWTISLHAYLVLPSFFYLVKGKSHSLEVVANDIKNIVGQENLSIIKSKDDESFDSLLFYYGKRIKLSLPEEPLSDGYYVARSSLLNSSILATESENLSISFEGKRLADGEDKAIVLLKRLKPNLGED